MTPREVLDLIDSCDLPKEHRDALVRKLLERVVDDTVRQSPPIPDPTYPRPPKVWRRQLDDNLPWFHPTVWMMTTTDAPIGVKA